MKKHGSFPYLVFVSFLLLPVVFAIHASASSTQPPAPVLFFADLILGANTGNSDTTYSSSGGVYVTLYGNYLSNYSSITLNGTSCLTVVSAPSTWLWYQRMTVMIGTGCSTGNFSITTPGGTWSGPMVSTAKEGRTYDFTVVTGSIYYVSSSGSDSNAGSFQHPWQHVAEAVNTMASPAITYVENGYSDSTDAGEGGIINPSPSQCAGATTTYSTTAQIAIVAYPGATVTLGPASDGAAAFSQDDANSACGGYEVAEILMRATGGTAMSVIAGGGACPTHCIYNMRFVADDLECPTVPSGDESGCIQDGGEGGGAGDPAETDGLVLYGMYLHDIGNNPAGNTLFHAEYHAVRSIEEGWGEIEPMLGSPTNIPWNCIQMYTSDGSWIGSDYHIHDMLIAGCDGHGVLWDLNADPATTGGFGGGNEMYNNVIWNTGISGNDNDCVQFASAQPSGSVTNNFYNNTLYNCGENTSEAVGLDTAYYASSCTSTTCILNMTNNVIYQNSGYYIVNNETGTAIPAQIIGTTNDLYGIGSISGSTVSGGWDATSSLNSNPDFTSTSTPNFVPLSSSPLIGAGSTSLSSTYDITGLVRPSPPSIGAYEYAAGTPQTPPSPPTGLQATLN